MVGNLGLGSGRFSGEKCAGLEAGGGQGLVVWVVVWV